MTPYRRSRSGTVTPLLAALVMLSIAGCTPLQPAEIAVPRQALTHFSLEGRVAAYDDNQSIHGQIAWIHAPRYDRWTLFTPLGQIAAQLEYTPHDVTLTTANGQHYQADTLKELPGNLVGITVPLEHLAHWIQAVPSHQAIVRQLDETGRPAIIIDQGWRIEYQEYNDNTPAALPRKLEVSQGTTRLRLVIDHWETPSE